MSTTEQQRRALLKPSLVSFLVMAALATQAQANGSDTGDAPASYGTATHSILVNAPHLGATPPDNNDGPATVGADGDVGDEDGVFDFPTLVQFSKAYTTNVFANNPSGQDATLVGWVDFDNNGIFEASEAATAIVPAGADNLKVKLTWNELRGVTGGFVGDTYARFRITSDLLTAEQPTGFVTGGEVEDYRLQMVSDVDGDQIADFEDPDNDNDGILDAADGIGIDTDNDGIENFLDTDSDDDTVPDFVEAGDNPLEPADTDNDGTPDFLDLDSDNNGEPDSVIVSGDVDGDGITGDLEGFGDADGDGVENFNDLDADNDLIPDIVEGTTDTDGDGVPNFVDLDSDNDGIPDIRESGVGFTEAGILDADGDGRADPENVTGTNGIVDSIETSPDSGILVFSIADTDSDGTRDYLDLDSDDDTISDLSEMGGDDLDSNGTVDALEDSDGDTVIDSVDVDLTFGEDTDGDSIDDRFDFDISFLEDDTDVDGVVDSADPDADGNGLIDEPLVNMNDPESVPDANENGIPDFLDDDVAVDNGTSSGPFVATPPVSSNSLIETGLQGSAGCTIGTSKVTDPVLPLLATLSLLGLGLRRRLARVSGNKR